MADITDITVSRIADLGRDAAGAEIKSLSLPTNALGLPSSINFLWDRKQGRYLDLKDVAEKWRIHPERKTGIAQVTTITSFIELVNRHKTEHSAIFARTVWPDMALTAVLDYHKINNAEAQFGQHRVHYPFPVTDALKAWLDQDDEAMTQHDFAVFIEERIAEIAQATPEEERLYGSLFQAKFGTPADMFSLSRGLEVVVNAKAKQQHTLSSGEREIVYTEDHDTKVTVPGLFMVSVPAFHDGIAVRLPARLRYRLGGGNVNWFYQLYQWEELLRGRVLNDIAKVKAESELPVYEGSPEMAANGR